MTPLESDVLHGLASGCFENLVSVSIFAFFYGVFVILFSVSAVIVVRQGFSNRATAAMFIMAIVNFLLYSLNAGIQVACFIVFIRTALTLDIDYPLSGRPELIDNALQNLDVIRSWASFLPMVLSDLIVVWRAWALFRDQQWVILVLFILWIGTVGLTVGDSIWLSIPKNRNKVISNLNISLTAAVIALSVAMSAVTTIVTAYKLWSHRKFIVNTLGLSRRKSSVQSILILLIESDLVYLVFQTAYLAILMVYDPVKLEEYFFIAVYLSLCAMYPSVVMILVETQRSPAASEAHLTTLSFAVGPISTTTNNRAESQRLRALLSQVGQEHDLQVESVLLSG